METTRETSRKATDILRGVVVRLGNALLEHDANHRLRKEVSQDSLAPSEFMRTLVMLCFRQLMVCQIRNSQPRLSQKHPSWAAVLPKHQASGSDTDLWMSCLTAVESPFFQALMPAGDLQFGGSSVFLKSLSCTNTVVSALCQTLSGLAGHHEGNRLGGWYESLLSYTPTFVEGVFRLERHRGYGRKSAGAYYTPQSLVELCVVAAVDEVYQKCAARGLSEIRICDPACGDGQFLVKALEHLRTLQLFEQADARCYVSGLYGVDLDPQAVELTRFNLACAVDYAPSALSLIAENVRVGNALLSGWFTPGEVVEKQASGNHLEALLDSQVPFADIGAPPFHWQREFGSVFKEHGGFDLVIGNPPWEKLEVIEREYFAGAVPALATTRNRSERETVLQRLAVERPQAFARYKELQRHVESIRRFVKGSGLYPLSAHGRLNTYRLFAELSLRLIGPSGQVAFYLPTGILTDYSTRHFVAEILSRRWLRGVLDFDNRSRFFGEVQGNVQFCLLRLSNEPTESFTVCTGLRNVSTIEWQEGMYALTPDKVRLMNPQTLSVPMFSSAQDSEIVSQVHARFGTLGGSGWDIALRQGTFNMTTAADQFRRTPHEEGLLPLYEAKLCQQFNHRHATFDGTPKERRYGTHAWANPAALSDLHDTSFETLPRYWVPRNEVERRGTDASWMLVVRNAFSALADARSLTATIIPKSGVGNSLTIMDSGQGAVGAAILAALLNSFMLDYVVREKSTGSNLNFYVLQQLPVPEPTVFASPSRWTSGVSMGTWFVHRVRELTFTSTSMQSYAEALGFTGEASVYEEARRRTLRAELDAGVFHLFGLSRASVKHVLDRFPVLRRREEERFGGYVSKDLVLAKYDAFNRA